jgi:hypothetical protein
MTETPETYIYNIEEGKPGPVDFSHRSWEPTASGGVQAPAPPAAGLARRRRWGMGEGRGAPCEGSRWRTRGGVNSPF